MTNKLRIGCVDFINALPLTIGLEGVESIFDIPSKLASGLKNGDLDGALVSSIEYAKNYPNYKIVDNLCISSIDKVESILLFSRVKFEDIKSVAVDVSTKSSVVLMKILFKEKTGNIPENYVTNPNLDEMLKSHDAALLIGDNAMKSRNRDEYYIYDLGEIWYELFSLPFVYALWLIKDDIVADNSIFMNNYKRNKQNLENLVKNSDEPEYNLHYIKNIIKYKMTNSHKEALKLFFRKAYEIGEVKELVETLKYN